MARELTALGEQPRIEDGGVAWDGDARSLMRANLWLRTASRVLVRLASFKATAFYELEKRGKKIPWGRFLPAGSDADFRVTAHKSRLYHSEAIAERLRGATGTTAKSRQLAANGPPPQLFVVRAVKDHFTISVDSSGGLLHMRGYRQQIGKAPLRETLAAALLLAGEWNGDSALLDPLCGSGTIAIEGALLARRIAPGIGRSFTFMRWPGFNSAAWDVLVSDARAGVLASSPVPIIASDRDAGAIEASRANAERAGVAGDIQFSSRAVSAIEPPAARGLVATNPPYGVRVSADTDVRNLYAQFGSVLRDRCGGWRVALLVSDRKLAGQLSIPLRAVLRTSNGGIKVTVMTGKVPGSTGDTT